MVFQIDAVKFLVVVGEGVGAGHVAVVAAAVFVLIVEDFGGEGGGA